MKNLTFLNKSFYTCILISLLFTQTNISKATSIFFDKPNNTYNNCYLPAPQNAHVEKVNSYSASVKWDGVNGNAGYLVRIYEIVDNVFNTTPVQEYEQQDTFRLFTNLASGRTYKIAISAICPETQSVTMRDEDVNQAIVYAVVQDDIVFSKRPTNPFSSHIDLTYEVAVPGVVNITILDMNGVAIIPVVRNEYREQGTYQTSTIPVAGNPGLYFLNFRKQTTAKTLKLMKIN